MLRATESKACSLDQQASILQSPSNWLSTKRVAEKLQTPDSPWGREDSGSVFNTSSVPGAAQGIGFCSACLTDRTQHTLDAWGSLRIILVQTTMQSSTSARLQDPGFLLRRRREDWTVHPIFGLSRWPSTQCSGLSLCHLRTVHPRCLGGLWEQKKFEKCCFFKGLTEYQTNTREIKRVQSLENKNK